MRLWVILTIILLVLSQRSAKCQNDFNDIKNGHWAKSSVEQLQADGILIGYSDGRFRGDRHLSHYELAVVFTKMQPLLLCQHGRGDIPWADSDYYEGLWMLLTQNKENQRSFKDVPSSHWAYEAVEHVSSAGIIEGYPDGQFHGDQFITRYELANALERMHINVVKLASTQPRKIASTPDMISAAKLVNNNFSVREQQYTDVPRNHWAYEAVNQMVLDAYPDINKNGRYLGAKPTTRYEFAVYLNKLSALMFRSFVYIANDCFSQHSSNQKEDNPH